MQDPGLAEQPWGSLDMELIDPFGNRLVFTNADCPVTSGFHLRALIANLAKHGKEVQRKAGRRSMGVVITIAVNCSDKRVSRRR